MEKSPLWTISTDGNGNQSVLDRILNGLQPRIQVDKRTDEIKAQETANAMEMLKRGQILALSHDPIGALATGADAPAISDQVKKKKESRPKTNKKIASTAFDSDQAPTISDQPVEPENKLQ